MTNEQSEQAGTAPQPPIDMERHLTYIKTRVGVIRSENAELPDDVDQALIEIMDLPALRLRLEDVFREVIGLVEGIETPRDAVPYDLSHELHSIWDEAVVALKAAGIDVLAEQPVAEELKPWQDPGWDAAFEKGRALGYDHGEAHDYAESVINAARIVKGEKR